MKDRAYKICRDFLSGTWKNISSTDMVFKTVSGGLSNLLYYCSLPETHTPITPAEPSQVLLRMYGQLHEGQKTEANITESIIFMMLSERRLGPKLYGIFPGGRLEEYIPARALSCQELHDPEISSIIARKLAGVHTLQAPIKKEPKWLSDKMNKWLEYIRTNITIDSLPEDRKELASNLLSTNFEAEVEWLRIQFPKVDSPVMFCHNDLQEGNILFPGGARAEGDNRLVFIDFEYCSYNYRAFDIANHFCEWCFDYSSPDYYPHFTARTDYPSEAEQLNFIRAYLSVFEDQPSTVETSHANTVEHIMREIPIFVLSSHFLWTLWAIIYNSNSSTIAFGYWEYAKARLDAYFKWKNEYFSSQ